VRRSRLIPTLTVAALAVGLTVNASTATAATTSPAAPRPTAAGHAQAVLQQAEALFAAPATPAPLSAGATASPTAPTAPAATSGAATDPTMTLLALAHVAHQLTGADRATARTILARPTDPNQPALYGKWTPAEKKSGHLLCGPDVCVHWTDALLPDGVTRANDDPPATDAVGLDPSQNITAGPDGIPDQVDQTLHALEFVWATEIGTMGYNPPKPDDRGAGTAINLPKIDIYLSNVGVHRLYGFCAPEQGRNRQSYGYCVLDNDYSVKEFGKTNSRLANLQVTAAHEFFHDIQFNYDSFEDVWFMESTAAWMEDEVYPNVNDNLQYLYDSPMSTPSQPLDLVDSSYLSSYGSWVFIRYLSDTFDSDVVRTAWTDAVGRPYSLQALDQALRDTHHTDVQTQFADFSAANASPRDFYGVDGARYVAYAANPPLTVRLGSGTKSSGWLTSAPLKHLSSIRLGAVPAVAKGHLKVEIVGPGSLTAPRARLVIHQVGGTAVMQRVKLVRGAAVVTGIAFGQATVKRVDVIMVNASTRTVCNRGTGWSCHGTPTDNRSVFRVRVTHTV